ncbi:MAG: hypothetical protein AAGI25_18065 [Bacteroidota bacterium]
MSKITKGLLRKYDSGLCTEQEKDTVQEWLYSDYDEEIDYSQMPEDEFEVEKEVIWEKLSQDIPIMENGSSSKQFTPISSQLFKYAASVSLIILSAVSLYHISRDIESHDISPSSVQFNAIESGIMSSIAVENGSKADMIFCGNSIVFNRGENEINISVASSCQQGFSDEVIMKPNSNLILYEDSKGKIHSIINGFTRRKLSPDESRRLKSLFKTRVIS